MHGRSMGDAFAERALVATRLAEARFSNKVFKKIGAAGLLVQVKSC